MRKKEIRFDFPAPFAPISTLSERKSNRVKCLIDLKPRRSMVFNRPIPLPSRCRHQPPFIVAGPPAGTRVTPPRSSPRPRIPEKSLRRRRQRDTFAHVRCFMHKPTLGARRRCALGLCLTPYLPPLLPRDRGACHQEDCRNAVPTPRAPVVCRSARVPVRRPFCFPCRRQAAR